MALSSIKNYVKSRVRHYRLHREQLLASVPYTVSKRGGDCGWAICEDLVHRGGVVYSFGVGANVEWDIAMIEGFGVEVHAFDPTPESIAWVRQQDLRPEFKFHDYGIAALDGTLDFYPPKKPGRMHFSQDLQKFNRPSQPRVTGRVHRLSTILNTLGHQRIEVLKMDVEGTEFDCLPDLLQSGADIGQLLIEIHYHHPTRSFYEGVSLIRAIVAAGFMCFSISERGLEFGFVNRRWMPVCKEIGKSPESC
jgi:FkbM family methyltransferase